MNTQLTHNGISINLEMNEPPFELKDRGWLHPAKVMKEVATDELDKLHGLELWGCPVKGVERFATAHQRVGQRIMILLEKKLW